MMFLVQSFCPVFDQEGQRAAVFFYSLYDAYKQGITNYLIFALNIFGYRQLKMDRFLMRAIAITMRCAIWGLASVDAIPWQQQRRNH